MIRGWSFIIIIKVNRIVIKILIVCFVIFSVLLNIYSYVVNLELTRKYESLVSITNQLDKAGVISFMTINYSSEKRQPNIEIFDISKGEVIKSLKSNNSLQNEAAAFIKGITGLYIKVNAIPDRGYIIRIPFETPLKVTSKWLNDYNINSVNEIFLILPEDEPPYLLVLDENQRPFFYNFKGNTDKFLKDIGFKP